MKEKLLKSSFFRFVEVGTQIVISILLTPFLIHNLGEAKYGLWILIFSALGWFKLSDFGFSSAVHRHIVFALESTDKNRVNVIFSVAAVLFFIIGSFAAIGVLALASFPSLLGTEKDYFDLITLTLSLLSIKVFWDLFTGCFNGFFSAYLRLDIDANLSSLNTIIRTILIYSLVIEMGIYGIVIAILIADFITNLLKIYYVKRLQSNLKFEIRLVKWSEVQNLFAFSKHVIATSIASSIKGRSDPIIITYLMNVNLVALYSVTSRLATLVEGLVTAIVGIFQSVFTRKVAKGEEIGNIFKCIVSVNCFVVLLLYTPLAILAEDFIKLWIGDEFASAAHIVFILGFAFICKSVSRPITSVLFAQAKHRLLSVINLVGAFLNVGLSIILGSIWGLEGIAIATVISFVISDVALHLLLYKYHNKQAISPIVFQFAFTYLLYVSLFWLGNLMMQHLPPLHWLEILIAGVLLSTFITASTYHMLIPVSIRSEFKKSLLKKLLPFW